MLETKMHKSVLLFETLPEFLTAYYEHYKREKPRFSFEMWSRSLNGIDRSLLKQISKGHRSIPVHRVVDFVVGLRFNEEEKQHFLDLVRLGGGEIPCEGLKRIVSDRVRYHQDLFLVTEYEKFLSTPQILILATLFSFEDLDRRPENLATMTGGSCEQVLQWMEVLRNLGMIKEGPDGTCRSTNNSFHVPRQPGASVLQEFHQRTLAHAVQQVKAEVGRSNFEFALLPLTSGEFQEYLSMMKEFRNRVLARFDSKQISERTLFQVNLAISPAQTSAHPS